jgi:hypothetical protein
MTGEARSPFDDLLDLTLYLPLGAAAELKDLLPELAARGRREVHDRLRNYRAVGELAVGFAQQRGPSIVMGALTTAIERLRNDVTGATSATSTAAPGEPAAGPTDAVEPVDVAPIDSAATSPPPERAELPIDGYDALSAVQVLPRLTGLSDEDLALVEDYERSGRGRRTILSKIEQLRARSAS